VIGWLAGWRDPFRFGGALFIAGGVAIVVGVMSLYGTFGITRHGWYLYAQSAGPADALGRLKRQVQDTERSYGFLALMSASGVLAMALGILIQVISR
jgi:hypothetical protein